jgi:mannobiose 2-epimerase
LWREIVRAAFCSRHGWPPATGQEMIAADSSIVDRLNALAAAVEAELRENLLPFWTGMQDLERGGFAGAATSNGTPVPSAPKGAVLHARILWALSAAYARFRDPALLAAATHAYRFISLRLIDPVWDGVFWAVSADGEPVEERKHLYAQAFALYGLAAFHGVSGDPEPLALAQRLWRTIEHRGSDPGGPGYLESFTRDWQVTANTLDKSTPTPRTFNTHLHLLEAYAALLEVWPDPAVLHRAEALALLMVQRMFDSGQRSFRQHFDADWRPLDKRLSYGHDIEATWLIMALADRLGPEIAGPIREALATLPAAVLERAVDADGGVVTGDGGDRRPAAGKTWWVQAEALVGFLDAFERSGELRFLSAAEGVWSFIRQFLVDRTGGEWRSRVAPAGAAQPDLPKVGLWKGPYHGVRACIETLDRTTRLAQARLAPPASRK